ncbi:hypothetical protein [Staphylococcus shinii]|uniref:hypothetical protein n=1 Tax=Staphylococcus shinii TaxID=2912228 RepID=UPI003F546149
MNFETFTIAQINFTFENGEKKAYMNIPPCNEKSKQHEVYYSDEGLICNYKGTEKLLEHHLSLDDRIKLRNSMEIRNKNIIVELLDWDKFVVKKRRA